MVPHDDPKGKNSNVDGYKVEGDGNAPNRPPAPGNASFDPNPAAAEPHISTDIPGQEFNINDKAYADSSKKDFVKTVSAMQHADEDTTDTKGRTLPPDTV